MNNLYAENKWARWYLELCHSRQRLQRKKLRRSHPDYVYYELHHIDAEALGGSNDASNLVLLTPREHIWAHILMPKALKKLEHKQRMSYALGKMKGNLAETRDGKEFFNSRIYEIVRNEYNRLGGLPQTPEARESRKRGMLGKNTGPKTEPHRKSLSKSKSKFFIFFDPEGRLRLGDNLLAFCQELGLNQSRMNGLRKHGYPYKNWSVPLL